MLKLYNLLSNVFVYCRNKFLNKQYFATYVAFSSCIYIIDIIYMIYIYICVCVYVCVCLLRIGSDSAGVGCVMRLGFAVKTPKRLCWRCSCVFIVNFKLISHLALVFKLMALDR